MPKIRVILEGDDGQQMEQVFALPSDLNSLDVIDEAVERFKNQTLPKVEQALLEQALLEQALLERLVAKEKKTLSDRKRS